MRKADWCTQVSKKIKYAKFHAARILKAIKEGGEINLPPPEPDAPRLPPPPPMAEEVTDEEFDRSMAMRGMDDAPISTPPPPPRRPQDEQEPVSPEFPVAPSAPAGGYFPPAAELSTPNDDFPHDGNDQYRFPSPPPGLAPSAPPGQQFQAGPATPTQNPFQQAPHSQNPFQPAPVQPQYQNTPAPYQPPQSALPQQNHYTNNPYGAPAAAPVRKQVGEDEMKQAQKYAKWAISALDYEDIDNAVKQLKDALAVLGAS